MSAEIILVQEIHKFPCLYNNNLPEYNRKDLTEEAWAEVARNNNLTVGDCKEKWRNIRCSFLRSLKPTAKYKKPYYLTAYLQFLLPFMKSRNNFEIIDDAQVNEALRFNSPKDINVDSIKEEADEVFDRQSGDESINMEIPVTIGEAVNPDSLISRQQSLTFRRRRRPTPVLSKTDKKAKRPKYNQGHTLSSVTGDENKVNGSAMRYFLLSMLPEFETMSDEQIRLFKIKVMLLIDEIKTNDAQVRQILNNIEDSNRLQKRLINLLIKTLKKTA